MQAVSPNHGGWYPAASASLPATTVPGYSNQCGPCGGVRHSANESAAVVPDSVAIFATSKCWQCSSSTMSSTMPNIQPPQSPPPRSQLPQPHTAGTGSPTLSTGAKPANDDKGHQEALTAIKRNVLRIQALITSIAEWPPQANASDLVVILSSALQANNQLLQSIPQNMHHRVLIAHRPNTQVSNKDTDSLTASWPSASTSVSHGSILIRRLRQSLILPRKIIV